MTVSADRYAGKPLVRLLECYVLWAIQRLDDKQAAALVAMTPKLQSIYAATGEWSQIISAVMHFPSDMPDKIRDVWARNISTCNERGSSPDPQEFAQSFVD